MEINTINIGDWVSCSGEGYGIVTKIHPICWDIFHPEIYEGGNREDYIYNFPENELPGLGVLATYYYQCKRFCNYDGTLIRSHKMRYCTSQDIEIASSKDMKIISKAITQHPKEYESFLEFDRNLECLFEIHYWVDNIEDAELSVKLFQETIQKQLSEKFTSTELKEVMEKNNCPFKLDKPAIRGNTQYPTTKKLIELILYFNIGDYLGKQTLYNRAKIWYYGMNIK